MRKSRFLSIMCVAAMIGLGFMAVSFSTKAERFHERRPGAMEPGIHECCGNR